MAFRKPDKKEDKPQKPQKGLTPKPFGRRGLPSPKYKKRNPHKDSGDKKPSLKTKASIIKDKAEKGQGFDKGGAVKMFQRRGMPGIAKIVDITSRFLPTPKSGTISTIESPAKKFVDIRTRVKKAGGYAMGGQARDAADRATAERARRQVRRKDMMDMLDRLYGKKKIVPKKKPKKDK